MTQKYFGIDVSKQWLDVADSDGRCWRVSNDGSGQTQLSEQFVADDPALIVMEATGGLERELAVVLSAASPWMVRWMASLTGVDLKLRTVSSLRSETLAAVVP